MKKESESMYMYIYIYINNMYTWGLYIYTYELIISVYTWSTINQLYFKNFFKSCNAKMKENKISTPVLTNY